MGREIIRVVAKIAQSTGTCIAQARLSLLQAALSDQHLEPSADEAAAGYSRQIVEIPQQAPARESLHDAQAEGRAANASTGKTQSRQGRLVSVRRERFVRPNRRVGTKAIQLKPQGLLRGQNVCPGRDNGL